MKRAVFVSLGWLLTGLALYALILGLELYWNLYDWKPVIDWRAWGVFSAVLIVLRLIQALARAPRHRLSLVVSLVVCVALLTLAAYVSPPEPLTHGVFARETSSPLWYRATRFVVMALPFVFWCLEWRNRRSHATRTL